MAVRPVQPVRLQPAGALPAVFLDLLEIPKERNLEEATAAAATAATTPATVPDDIILR